MQETKKNLEIHNESAYETDVLMPKECLRRIHKTTLKPEFRTIFRAAVVHTLSTLLVCYLICSRIIVFPL